MKKWRDRTLGMISVLAGLGIWQLASMTNLFYQLPPKTAKLILPSPIDVLKTLYYLTTMKEVSIFHNLFYTLSLSFYRIIVGFCIAAIIGVPLGILAELSSGLNRVISPWIRIIQPIPGVAWIPLALIWFGSGNRSSIFIITVSAVVPILLNTMEGVRSVDLTLIQAAQTLGARKKDVFLKVILPGAFPSILTGFRLAVGFSWRVDLAAEMVGVRGGLGYQLIMARGIARTDIVFATIVTLSATMLFIEKFVFGKIEERLLKWRKGLKVSTV